MIRQISEAAGVLLVAALIVTSFVTPSRALCPPGDCGPGEFWIDMCPPGIDFLRTEALVGLDLDLDNIADVSLIMGGPTNIVRQGEVGGEIQTEIVSMSLTGGGYTLTAGVGNGECTPPLANPSPGAITPTPDPAVAESFFDVYFEVEFPSGMCLWNHAPLTLRGFIDRVPPCGDYLHPTQIVPLFDSQTGGNHLANLVSARHRVYAQQQHYQTYKILPPITSGLIVQVRDQFVTDPNPMDVGVLNIERLLVPISKNYGEILDPFAHLTWWTIAPDTMITEYLEVDNQLHPPVVPARVIINGPLFMLAPAGKDPEPGPPFPQIPTTVDHYLCYDATTLRDPGDTVRVQDQFIFEEFVRVQPMKYFCAPCEKTNGPDFYPIQDPDRHLALYPIEPFPFQTVVDIADQFAVVTVDLLREPIEYLVVPSGKVHAGHLVGVGSIETELPFALLPPSPNPSTGSTTIQFNLPRESDVELVIYDIAGRRVRELVAGPVQAGRNVMIWDGRNEAGEAAANGIYFVRLTWDGGTEAERVTIMR
jgi:hypothetical protein